MRKILVLLIVVGLLALVPVALAQTTVVGSGTLVAEGDGMATLQGSGSVTVSGSGMLRILDRGGDAEITVSGNGGRTLDSVREGAWVVYRGFEGQAYVSGSNIIVSLRGDDITLEANGTGRVYLRGQGTYTVNGDEGRWLPRGRFVQLEANS